MAAECEGAKERNSGEKGRGMKGAGRGGRGKEILKGMKGKRGEGKEDEVEVKWRRNTVITYREKTNRKS